MSTNNTLAIMQGIQTLINNADVGYKTVALEAIKDWTDLWPVCEIAFVTDSSQHYAMGGTIEDVQGFRITTAVNFTRQTELLAITSLTSIRDKVVSLFMQHAYLAAIPGVSDSRVRPETFRLSFMRVSGDDYKVHEFVVEVSSMYTVPIGASGI